MRTLTILLALAAAAFGQSPYNDPLLGTRPGAFSARSLSLGHTFLTDQSGPAALMGNPATMAEQETRWRFDLSGDLSRNEETRKYPFYDAFDGVLGYNNYALNDHLYSKLDGGAAYRIPTSAVPSFVVSAASYSTYRFDYRYHEEVRSRYSSGGVQDLKLGENRIDVTGDLRSISLGAAARVDQALSAGFSVNILSGKWDWERGTYYESEDSTNFVDRIAYEPEGTPAEFAIGATWELNERVMFGARALMPTGNYKIKQDVKQADFFENVDSSAIASGTITIPYPQHFAVGVRYRPQNEFRPILLLEGEIHTYSDISSRYDDTFEIRAGAEQEVVAGSPVRLGFVYASAPEDETRATTMFTAGIGFTLHKLTGDFGLEIGKINSMEDDLFPQHLFSGSTADDRLDKDKVETALFRGMITLRYAL